MVRYSTVAPFRIASPYSLKAVFLRAARYFFRQTNALNQPGKLYFLQLVRKLSTIHVICLLSHQMPSKLCYAGFSCASQVRRRINLVPYVPEYGLLLLCFGIVFVWL